MALGVGFDFDRTPHRLGHHGVPIVIETHERALRDRGGVRAVAIERRSIGEQRGAFLFEDLEHRALGELGMALGLGVTHTALE